MNPLCDHLETFFDGEVATDAADTMRGHVATCDRCQRRLRDLMEEATVLAGAAVPTAPSAPERHSVGAVLPFPRRRRIRRGVGLALVVAVAAAAGLWLARPRRATREANPQIAIAIDRGRLDRGDARRIDDGSALVGDTLHIEAHGGRRSWALWIFRDDRLIAACPGPPPCRRVSDGEAADIETAMPGLYRAVYVTGLAGPLRPLGELDADVAGATRVGASLARGTIDVR